MLSLDKRDQLTDECLVITSEIKDKVFNYVTSREDHKGPAVRAPAGCMRFSGGRKDSAWHWQRDRGATPDCVFTDDTAHIKYVRTQPVREKLTSGRTPRPEIIIILKKKSKGWRPIQTFVENPCKEKKKTSFEGVDETKSGKWMTEALRLGFTCFSYFAYVLRSNSTIVTKTLHFIHMCSHMWPG